MTKGLACGAATQRDEFFVRRKAGLACGAYGKPQISPLRCEMTKN
jgi:hypothetical protein